jgi:hypothetical protein
VRWGLKGGVEGSSSSSCAGKGVRWGAGGVGEQLAGLGFGERAAADVCAASMQHSSLGLQGCVQLTFCWSDVWVGCREQAVFSGS